MKCCDVSPAVSRTVSIEQLCKLRGKAVTPWLHEAGRGAVLHYSGQLELLCPPVVVLAGSRSASERGLAWARLVTKELVRGGATVMSGLARGIDAQAHCATLAAGGRTVGVLGTPLDRVYPAEHAGLQQRIGEEHLLLSPFEAGSTVRPSNFPFRNTVMAALCDAVIVVEAADRSGSLSMMSAALKAGKPLFLPRWLIDHPALSWPRDMVSKPGVYVLETPHRIKKCLGVL